MPSGFPGAWFAAEMNEGLMVWRWTQRRAGLSVDRAGRRSLRHTSRRRAFVDGRPQSVVRIGAGRVWALFGVAACFPALSCYNLALFLISE